MNIKPILRSSGKTVKSFMTKFCPEILTGFGITGFLGATINAISATSKAKNKIREEEEKKGEPLTKKEIAKLVWKYYIPTTILCMTSTACVVGASTINYKRNLALATMCTVADTTLNDYKEEVGKVLGPKKMEQVEGAADAKKIERNPPDESCVYNTGRGNTLMYEPFSNYYFRSSLPDVESALVKADSFRNSGDDVSMSDIYELMGLPRSAVGDMIGYAASDEFGYTGSNSLIYDSYHKSACLTPGQEPCIQIVLKPKLLEDFHRGDSIY